MKSFQVLDRTTEVFGRYFLEASAGTGKTFAIEHIAVRALLESIEPLSIDQILIVTFTRAATRELKVRLRSNLSATLHHLRDGMSGPDYLQPIFAKGSAAIFSAIRKMEDALYNFDRAQIFTLHGFCHKMLSEFAFEAGTFFEITPPEDASHSQQLFQVVTDFFRAGLDRRLYSPSQIEGVLKSSSRGMEGLCKRMAIWIEKSLSIPSSSSFTDTLDEVQKAVALLHNKYPSSAEMLLQDFTTLATCYKKIQSEHFSQVENLVRIIKRNRISYEDWDHIIGCKEYFLPLLNEDNLKKGKDPKKLSLHSLQLLADLKDLILPLIELASHTEKNFLRLVDDCMRAWKQSLYYEESFAPDDLLKKMADAIKKPELKNKISEKYHLAIIDEFQDTDPLQWEIFKSLFLSEGSEVKAIYLVGDPKQSIYAFRNADVYTYLAALETLGEKSKVILNTNYRSEPVLVQALNALFTTHISKDWMQMPSTGKFLEVLAVHAKAPFDEQLEKKERSNVHFFIAEGSSGRGKKWPSVDIEDDQLFPFIVSEIQRMTMEEGYNFSQFAILVRDRFQASRLELFLKKWQVPCSVRKSFSIEESIAYLGLHDLVKAVISPDDVGCLKRALGGAFIGLSAHELIGGMELAFLQKARLYFQSARSLVTKKGWGAFFSSFLSSSWKEDNVSVLEDILSRKDKSLYFEMRQLLQILLQGSKETLYSLEGFYAFFTDLALSGDESELLKMAAESEEDQVIVMTIHASKGLEFDIVFALGLVSRGSGSEDILRTKVEGKELLEIWDLSNESCLQAVLETDAEKMRQLYVALTRAKTRVYIPVAIDLDRKPVKISSASAIDLLCQSFGRDQFDLMSSYQTIPDYSSEMLISHLNKLGDFASVGYTLLATDQIKLKDGFAPLSAELCMQKPFSLIFPSKTVLSFTSLHHASQKDVDPLDKLTLVSEEIKEDTLPLGAATGTFLHRIFELILKDGLHRPYQDESIADLLSQQMDGHPLKAFQRDIELLVKEVIHAPLDKEKSFSFADIPPKNIFLEMEFAFEFEGHLMKGFIDGVFVWQNKYYLVDWKSNYLGSKEEDYSEAAMEKAMTDQGYFLQAAIYAEALKRYLSQVEKRSFNTIFGGAFYVFLRGRAPYHFMPDLSMLEKVHTEGALCH